MKKVLATILFGGIVCLSLGIVGCGGDTKDKGKKADGKADAGATEVKFKDIEAVKAKKGEEVKVPVELTEKATTEITLTAKAKDNDKITGSGKIAKDGTKGDLMVKTGDKEGAFEVEVTASGEKIKGSKTFKLEVIK